MDDVGGDPACWAHVFGDDLVGSFAAAEEADDRGDGVVWSLPHGGGLDANVVRLSASASIGEHVNDAVDVLVVVWSGSGEIVVDERRTPLLPGTIVLVPRRTSRRVAAGREGLVYLSAHPPRGPMSVARPGQVVADTT